MLSERYSQSVEDYLKAIYDLSATYGRATTNQLAERLEVRPASVTGMLKKMAVDDPPLLVYHKHHGVELTPQGERAALEVIRHHRLLELYLQRALGYPWEKVHEEADRLEHVISEDFEERISQILGNPGHDPHGEPIPDRDLHLPKQSSILLSELRPDQNAIIERVNSSDEQLLHHLGEIGLVPDAHITVKDYSSFDENLTVFIRGQKQPVVLGPKVTEQVFVIVLSA
jgi:DtxR family transcriptional regulator, Mn-dependent transcriptional regulator